MRKGPTIRPLNKDVFNVQDVATQRSRFLILTSLPCPPPGKPHREDLLEQKLAKEAKVLPASAS